MEVTLPYTDVICNVAEISAGVSVRELVLWDWLVLLVP